ncbi:MAG: hypothetical protein GY794_09505, partial [bacterium]|nr:hypothetical protein [bacterium]
MPRIPGENLSVKPPLEGFETARKRAVRVSTLKDLKNLPQMRQAFRYFPHQNLLDISRFSCKRGYTLSTIPTRRRNAMHQNEPHDQHFKNIFLDFPKEALEWLLPQALEEWGPAQQVEFVRQEPKKRRLTDAHLALDMPILFSFQGNKQLLLWLVEFQEDKSKFSIYKLAHYTLEMMEAHPQAVVAPTVLFTNRKKWRKDVSRHIESVFHERTFLRFEYVFVKLFDFQARDYYRSSNPVVKILLPKMLYPPEERWEVIRQAYIGLFQFVSLALFEKYMDFIDIYAEVREDEREQLQQELQEQKEFVMIRQMIKEEGFREGEQKGLREGEQKGLREGEQKGLREGEQKGLREGEQKGLREGTRSLLTRQLSKKYQ